MNFKNVVCFAVASSLTGTVAFGHGGATGIVKERMDGMGVMGKAVKLIAPMMQGEVAYDADAIRDAAEEIGRHAGDALTKLFPEGSLQKPTEAKPEIWENWDQFVALAEQLQVFSEGLALAADNGVMMGGSQPAATMMGGGTMMGGTGMMSGTGMMMGQMPAMDLDHLAEMPADGVFNMMSQTCAACHTLFRAESQ